MSILSILKRAKARIEDKNKWTQYAAARTIEGWICDAKDTVAVSFCATGSLEKEAGSKYEEASNALYMASNKLFGLGVITINDERGHDSVLAIYDEAIAAAKQQKRKA